VKAPRIGQPGDKRAFRVRRAPPYIGRPFWWWECTLCHPPAHGGRYGREGYRRILGTSMPYHFAVRESHHKYVRVTRGGEL
jgi:hypothetical protein